MGLRWRCSISHPRFGMYATRIDATKLLGNVANQHARRTEERRVMPDTEDLAKQVEHTRKTSRGGRGCESGFHKVIKTEQRTDRPPVRGVPRRKRA